MSGPGRPFSPIDRSKLSSACWVSSAPRHVILAITVWLILVSGEIHGQSARAPEANRISESITVRVSWGGGKAAAWAGSLRVSGARVKSTTPLAMSWDGSTAALQVGQQILIQHQSPVEFGGVDLHLEPGMDPKLEVSFGGDDPGTQLAQSVDLTRISTEPVSLVLDEFGNRLTVMRPPYNSVAVDFSRDHLVFNPGEQFRLRWNPVRSPLTTRNVRGLVQLIRVGTTNEVIDSQTFDFELDKQGTSTAQPWEFNLPEQEGVYRLGFTLEPVWYQPTLNLRKDRIRREIELVVVGSQSPHANLVDDGSGWRVIASVDPADEQQQALSRRWSFRAPREILPAGDGRDTVDVDLQGESQRMTKLNGGGWIAIPLTFSEPGRPHAIEIDYVAGQPLSLGASLLEPGIDGQIDPQGADSGLCRIESIIPDPQTGKRATHRFVVWPQARESYLYINNRLSDHAASIGKVRVLRGPKRLPEVTRLPTWLPQNPANPVSQPDFKTVTSLPRRRCMALLTEPMFTQSLGVEGRFDEASGQVLEDWNAFLVAADRLAQLLKRQGFSGLYLTVATDGSAIFPSSLLQPTPRFDTGAFFSKGNDPVRKDVVELLFRIFEREGLELVPLLRFNSPLPSVELARQRGTANPTLVDFNRNQRPMSDSLELPVYNPLDRAVQHAVTEMVVEFTDRYHKFDSFRGVGLVAAPDTYLMLPGKQWCFDETTISRFAQTQTGWTVDRSWGQVRDQLLGSRAEAWTQWRAQQMSQWYQLMARELEQRKPGAALFLAPTDLQLNKEFVAAISPSLHRAPRIADAMQALGWQDGERAETQPSAGNIRLIANHTQRSCQSVAQERVTYALHNAGWLNPWWKRRGVETELIVSRGSWVRLDQLAEQTPFVSQVGPMVRYQPQRVVGPNGQQSFVQALKERDSTTIIEGGKRLLLMDDPEWNDLMATYSQLPATSFRDVPSRYRDASSLPVAVRQKATEEGNYFYLVNVSPWPVEVSLEALGLGDGQLPSAEMFSLSPIRFAFAAVQTSSPTVATAKVEIKPFGLLAGRMPAGEKLKSFQFALPSTTGKDLRRRVLALQTKLTKSQQAQPLPVLTNGDFEREPHRPIVGWSIGQQPQERFAVKRDYVRADGADRESDGKGRRYLEIANPQPQPVWIRSNSFAMPDSGRLSISAWLRTDSPDDQPPLRISVEGKLTNGESYYRFGSVGSLSPNPKRNQVGNQWKRFAVHFDDLPVGQVDELRIGFDLMAPGSVQISEVHVYDHWFDDNDARAITQMLASTDAMLMRPELHERCRRLLESYWAIFLDRYVVDEDRVSTGERRSSAVGEETSLKGDQAENATEGLLPKRPANRKVPMFRRLRSWGR